MDWIDKWNEALEMLEKSLTAEISLDDIARTACCTTFHFQRMFSYLADMPLSEYIRRRKMTKAAFDLQSGAKVIDVALKYGYRSPTAFTRAFQSIHGITPSQAKAKGAPLKAFPPIRFQMTVKGVTALDYRIEAKGPLRIAGIYTPLEKDMEKNFQIVPAFWQKTVADNILPKLIGIMEMPAVLGISACQEEEWKYWIGVWHFQRSGTASGNSGTACCHMGHLPRHRRHAKSISGIGETNFYGMAPHIWLHIRQRSRYRGLL